MLGAVRAWVAADAPLRHTRAKRLTRMGEKMTEHTGNTTRHAMKRYLVIRNGHGIVAEGDTMEELERTYERFVEAPPEGVKHPPAFGRLEFCHLETEDDKLCILDTRENPEAAESYYNVGYEGDTARS